MSFPFNIYLLAGFAACAGSLLSLPFWCKFCLWVGLIDDPGHRKIHQVPIPLAGGLAVLTGILLPLASGWLLLQTNLVPAWLGVGPNGSGELQPADLLQYGFEHRGFQLAIILLGALGMAILGSLDDCYELRPARKFAGQLLIAALTAVAGVRITLFVDNLLFSYAITILWILSVTNAFNFMDNMNGLCAGLGAIAAWCIGLSAMTQVHYLVATLAFVVCGALLGFLPYNFPRATAFLGDTGSHLTGYLLAVLAILPHFYSPRNPRPLAVLMPVLVLGIPLLDLAWVVLIRWRHGKPFYIGDTNHLSHRLVRGGLTQSRAVVLLWLLAAGLGATALCLGVI